MRRCDRRGLKLPALLGTLALAACAGNNGENVRNPANGGSAGSAGSAALAGNATMTTGGESTGGGGAAGSANGNAGMTSAGTSGAATDGVAPVIAAGVRWFGRVDVSDVNAIKFAWSGSGFVGTFEGPSVAVKLKTVGGGDIFFQPVVDGKPGERFSVASTEQTIELAKGLKTGPHRIELYRETEGKGFGYSVFSGFAVGTPGELPTFSGRLIEVIGDSISAGFGNLGSEQHPNYGPDPNGGCPFTTETQSAYMAYGHVAAREVEADASVLAGSGWGIYSDNTGNRQNVMPALFGNVLGEAPKPAWSFAVKPQAVVINLGTNDASAKKLTPENFKPAYRDFIEIVRKKYPNALILCAVGSLLSGADRDSALKFTGEVIAELGDKKIELLDLGTQDVSAGTGCSWHPNAAEDARMAKILVARLKKSLGW